MTQATVSSRRPARYPSPCRDTAAAIDARLVRRLIAEQFPRYRELPVAAVVPGGHDNRTLRVGDSLCARLPSASRYASRPPIEYAWLPRLAGHLPLPIPHPVALGAPGAGYPWHWTLNRWIRSKPATPSNIRDLSGFARRLASFLSALHQALDKHVDRAAVVAGYAAEHEARRHPDQADRQRHSFGYFAWVDSLQRGEWPTALTLATGCVAIGPCAAIGP